MNAESIMTLNVITVAPATLVRALAALLFEHGISAAPVLADDRLVGIVSKADLPHCYEAGADCALRSDPWWLRSVDTDRLPEKYVRSLARHVRDIMTCNVVTVAPDAPLGEIAALLERRRCKRLPVLRQGKLVGIVSRSDLVRALADANRTVQAT